MSSKSISPILQAWYRWKMLRLPWRKRFLVGLDLNGNTYWEFRLAPGDPTSLPTTQENSNGVDGELPFRRIVHYPRSTHYSEVKVPPQWHQWLRYRRPNPPTLREQREDVARQERMKILAAEADRRWEAKGSLLDMPTKEEDGKRIRGGRMEQGEETQQQEQQRENNSQRTGEEQTKEDDPWKKAARANGPSESWQPESWNPGSLAPRKR